jgi:hypothetical protein
MRRQGFNGSVSEYYTQLKEDPRFHKNTPVMLQNYISKFYFEESERLID